MKNTLNFRGCLKSCRYVKIKVMDKKYKILIIDDDRLLLDMYATKFKEEKFDVDIAVGAKEALDKIKNGASPDIILLDIVMPGMDGFELMAEIKKENLAKDSKIIFLTNLGQKEDINKGMSLGALDYIIKAYFTPSEVVNKIKDILKK
ncbi:MAG: Response regulator receiver domain protein [Parcubacteria group bacterium GW2011_GWC2_40_31]|nr:MAG: Response regulator receiver domain protein [Parcubacteria group bacterium GW2011_GWF2_40_10]KKR47837.1 MAG: Response regulator receiver domain protein [Parcubacteria group bacterium GW2011_GWA2_40_143]KKR60268.1 MAG: Response regulator receiver domain protein [Parcubacteria group bacterium GW2011_GWC2_40_31]KKR80905.1 MAG: Response regulator receiver domain protein [Parcubacteria group bacterium GW2011_GWD2_40_9]